MAESLFLGAIQGFAEWLPISSEGIVVLARTRFFNGNAALSDDIFLALFLHLGTFLAAFVYFRQEVFALLRGAVRYREAAPKTRSLLRFLVLATVVSGVLGTALLRGVEDIEDSLALSGKIVTAGIGMLLIVTGALQLRAHRGGTRGIGGLTGRDALIVGIAQGFAVLPGLSRSGLTVAALLLRGINDVDALKASFLMSLPAVLAGNIVFNAGRAASFGWDALLGVAAAFAFGLLTIHVFLRFARRVNFGFFIASFGALTLLAAFI